jgi:hypothetical protein
MSEGSDMSTSKIIFSVSKHYKKLSVLILEDKIIISSKCNLAMIYLKDIAHLALKNNH